MYKMLVVVLTYYYYTQFTIKKINAKSVKNLQLLAFSPANSGQLGFRLVAQNQHKRVQLPLNPVFP